MRVLHLRAAAVPLAGHPPLQEFFGFDSFMEKGSGKRKNKGKPKVKNK